MPKGPGGVLRFGGQKMATEPAVKRAVAFFDGQNLFRHAMAAFGHYHPNYDPNKLFNAICAQGGWKPFGVRFYTGTPAADKDAMWHAYWANRLLAMRRAGILVVSRPLRYHKKTIPLPDGTDVTIETPEEKGIDVRLALDVIRMTLNSQFDVAVIFSQDQDLAEVAAEVREISKSQDRWLKVVSAYPSSATASATRGIDKTEWLEMDRAFYDAHLDPRDYRPKRPTGA
jgi:uncharacterized LabA/DUF88 family protein